jgi:hypothetical protein
MEEEQATREKGKRLVQEIQANMTSTQNKLGIPDEYFYILRLVQREHRQVFCCSFDIEWRENIIR